MSNEQASPSPAQASSDPAEICAEMAREAATRAARNNSLAQEDGDEFALGAAAQFSAQVDALREAERRIRTRLSAWLPIDSAPKDGTRILAFFPDESDWYQFSVCCWSARNGAWWGCSPSASGVCDSHPLFWMPLPTAPATSAEGK